MIDRPPQIETITFDAGVVANRMQLLMQIKPLAWQSYLMRREAGKEIDLNIDFSQPVSRTQLATFGNMFDIDAFLFFSVRDEELQANPELFLRPEED